MREPLILIDDDGKFWYRYSVVYNAGPEEKFSFEFWAKDFADAEYRLTCIMQASRLDGRLIKIIPVDTKRLDI
jgi:hypothetical protein